MKHSKQKTNIPLLTIIIINWNGIDFLPNCLRSIKTNDRYSHYEIIIVDNGSTDRSIDYIKLNYPKIKIIKNLKNQGFAKANNQAINASKSDYYFFLNNDTEVFNDWLDQSVSIAQSDSKIGIVGSKIYYMDGNIQYMAGIRFPLKGVKNLPFIKYIITKWAEKHDCIMTVRNIQGSAFLVKREVFNTIGLFDEGFFIYGEEGDLCYRARGAGFKVMYNPHSKVKHLSSGTSSKNSILSYFHRMKSDQRFTLLNFFLPRIFLHIIFGVSIAIVEAILHRRLSLLLRAYYENYQQINEIKFKRTQRKKWFF